MYEVKNSKICKFWTFCPVIQLINHLFQIRQKAVVVYLGMITELSTKISRRAVFASCIARILNSVKSDWGSNYIIIITVCLPASVFGQ